jgi:hypothetical protein
MLLEKLINFAKLPFLPYHRYVELLGLLPLKIRPNFFSNKIGQLVGLKALITKQMRQH